MNHLHLSDEQLIRFFLNGDPRAMKTLIELYKDRVYTTIVGLVHNRERAEEIFHEVFVTVIDRIIAGKGPGEGKFMTWAIQIAHSVCTQNNQRNRNSFLSDNTRGRDLFNANQGEPGGAAWENHGRIRNLIERLPERQREVLVLNHYSGLSFKEIAELLNCSLTSTLETMHAALSGLGRMMVEKELVDN